MTRTLLLIRKGAPEYELAGSFLSLSNTAAKKALIGLPPYAIASSAMEQDNRGLIRPNDILPIIKSPITMSNIPAIALLHHLLRQPRLPRRLSLPEASCVEDPYDRGFGDIDTLQASQQLALSSLLSAFEVGRSEGHP